MKKILSFVKGLLISVWVLLAVITTICLISFNDYHVSVIGKHSVFMIDSEELEPDFKENDLVILKKTPEKSYQEGDKAFFYLTNRSDQVYINYGTIGKIESAEFAESTFYFRAENDNNDVNKMTRVGYSDMMGKANGATVWHKWGLVLSILESRWGFMFLVIFPTIFAIVYEVYSIIEEAKSEKDEE